MKTLIIYIIKFYRRYISPLKTPSCRFTPTCSQYCIQAVEKYGAARGLLLSIKRILRCHPWNDGGYDPVPEHENRRV